MQIPFLRYETGYILEAPFLSTLPHFGEKLAQWITLQFCQIVLILLIFNHSSTRYPFNAAYSHPLHHSPSSPLLPPLRSLEPLTIDHINIFTCPSLRTFGFSLDDMPDHRIIATVPIPFTKYKSEIKKAQLLQFLLTCPFILISATATTAILPSLTVDRGSIGWVSKLSQVSLNTIIRLHPLEILHQ